MKWLFPEEGLRDAASAWHLYEGHSPSTWAILNAALIAALDDVSGTFDASFIEMCPLPSHSEDVAVYSSGKLCLLADCNLAWVSLVARQSVIDHLADTVHAAILSVRRWN